MKNNIAIHTGNIILALIAVAVLVISCLQINYLHQNLNQKEIQIGSISTRLDALENDYAILQETFEQAFNPSSEEKKDSNLLVNKAVNTTPAPVRLNKPAAYDSPPPPGSPMEALNQSGTSAIKGVKLTNGPSFDVFRIDPRKKDITFFHRNGTQAIGSIQMLNNLLKRQSKKIIFATNGGMFRPGLLPTGLYVENGREIYPLNLGKGGNTYTNFYSLPPNGVFYLTKSQTAGIVKKENYRTVSSNVAYATQSGPMVVINGKINPNFSKNSNSKFTRSGVGIRKDGTLVFAISQQAVTFYDFARIFLYYGCQNALYLDGAISEMYLPEIGRYQSTNQFALLIAVTENM